MPTLFRKTALGHAEIETRAHRLSPRLRSLLILVDGKRDTAALAALVPQQLEDSLQALLDQGFIEGQVAAAPPVAPATFPAPETTATAPTSPGVTFEQRRREAVRALNDALGPHAEALALRMEKARTADELRPLLTQAAQSLANLRGRAAATAFEQRFLQD